MRWTEENLRRLANLLAAGSTRFAAFTILKEDWPDLTPDAINNAIKDIRRDHPHWLTFQGDDPPDAVGAPPSVPRYDKAWTLEGAAAIFGDIHAPLTDWSFFAEACNTARQFGVSQLIVAGDLFDFALLSNYEAVVPYATHDAECEAAEYAIDMASRAFDKIWVFGGNHDERLLKRLNGRLSEQKAVETFLAWIRGNRGGKVEWSSYTYCTLRTPAGPWLICHPNMYRAARGATAAEIALLEHMHTVTLHEHHLGKVVDKSGRYVAVASGMMADPAKIAYTARYKNARPRMVKGYTIIDEGGVAHVYGGPVGFSMPGERDA